MLGREGAINILLMKAGIIHQPIEALLFTDLSVVIGMTQIYVVFMVGPIAFMLGRIDPNIIEAARDLGADFWRVLRKIIFPLSLPGVVVGAIFVSVMVLGEFATSAALSGRKVNLLGNIIVTEVGSLKWALASVVGVILTVIMGIVIAGAPAHRRSEEGALGAMESRAPQARAGRLCGAIPAVPLRAVHRARHPVLPEGTGRRPAIPDRGMVALLVPAHSWPRPALARRAACRIGVVAAPLADAGLHDDDHLDGAWRHGRAGLPDAIFAAATLSSI